MTICTARLIATIVLSMVIAGVSCVVVRDIAHGIRALAARWRPEPGRVGRALASLGLVAVVAAGCATAASGQGGWEPSQMVTMIVVPEPAAAIHVAAGLREAIETHHLTTVPIVVLWPHINPDLGADALDLDRAVRWVTDKSGDAYTLLVTMSADGCPGPRLAVIELPGWTRRVHVCGTPGMPREAQKYYRALFARVAERGLPL